MSEQPFDDFINGDMDMHEIGEVSCSAIHPIVRKALQKVNDDTEGAFSTINAIQEQALACMARELVPVLYQNVDVIVTASGNLRMPEAEALLRLIGSCALVCIMSVESNYYGDEDD